MGQFAVNLAAFAAKAGNNAEKVVRKVSIDMLSQVIGRSPVDTGRFRGNWVMTFGSPEISQSEAIDKTGASTINRQSARLAGFSLGQSVYIMNSLPYARVLEYGEYPNPPKNPSGKTVNGFSVQTPSGMVRITVSEFRNFIDKAIQESAS